MVHFLTDQLSGYYMRRLIDFAHNRLLQRMHAQFPAYADQDINHVSADVFEVASSKRDGSLYTVNTATCTCTCSEAVTGSLCKHLHYVFTITIMTPTYTNECRHIMYEVAAGEPASDEQLGMLNGIVKINVPVLVVMSEPPPPVEPAVAEDSGGAAEDVADVKREQGLAREELSELDSERQQFFHLWNERVDSRAEKDPQKFVEAYRAAREALAGVRTMGGAVGLLKTVAKYQAGTGVRGRKPKDKKHCADS